MVIGKKNELERCEIYSKNEQLRGKIFIFVVFTFAIIFSFLNNHLILGSILTICSAIFFLIIQSKEKRIPRLTIDAKGVNHKNLFIIEWREIKNIEVATYYDSDGFLRNKIIIASEVKTIKDFEIELDDLDIEKNKIEGVIRKFRLESKNK